MGKIEAKNNEWLEAIENACRAMLDPQDTIDFMSVRDQLLYVFDPDYGEENDEQLRKRLVKEYDLHVTIEKGELPHVSQTMRDAIALCEEILKLLPASFSRDLNPQLIQKSKYGFAKRGENAVFETFRNTNASFVELYVRTDKESYEDFLYWTKNKLFLIHFVEELDEEYAISTVGGSSIVYFKH